MSGFPSQAGIFLTPKRSACDRCRSQKLRCPPRAQTTDRCGRCSRLGVQCVTSCHRRGRAPPPTPSTPRRPPAIASRMLGSHDQSSLPFASLSATDSASFSPTSLETLFSADLSFAGSSQTSQSDHTLDRPHFNSSYFDAAGSVPLPDYTDNGEADMGYAETEAEDLHQSSSSKVILGRPPSIWDSDKRLAHLNLVLSTRLEQCPLGVDGSPPSASLSPSQDSGRSVESGSWGSHILGDTLRDTVEFIRIIESYTPPRRDLSTGPAKIPRLGTVVQLNLLSVHLQLIATYDRLLKHFCGQLCEDASGSSSKNPSSQATSTCWLSPFDLPGMEVAGFQVQQGTLQTKILLETILHNLAVVERLMGLPMTWKVTDRQRDTRGITGIFENKQARLVLEAVGLSAIDWTDDALEDHGKLPAVASLRDGIKRLQIMVE